jgi:uncharacterized protein YycO
MSAAPAQAGDILLFLVTPQSGWLGKLIGWGQKIIGQAPTQVAYEHAALVSGPGWIIEAYWPKVRKRAFDPSQYSNVEVWRYQNLTPLQLNNILAYANTHIGEWYNVSALLTFGMVQFGHTVVCSQFVWQAFTAAWISLCPYETLESPDDLAASPLLVKCS